MLQKWKFNFWKASTKWKDQMELSISILIRLNLMNLVVNSSKNKSARRYAQRGKSSRKDQKSKAPDSKWNLSQNKPNRKIATKTTKNHTLNQTTTMRSKTVISKNFLQLKLLRQTCHTRTKMITTIIKIQFTKNKFIKTFSRRKSVLTCCLRMAPIWNVCCNLHRSSMELKMNTATSLSIWTKTRSKSLPRLVFKSGLK